MTSLARRFASSGSSEPLLRSALHELLLSRGGQMVPFAGYELPVQFKGVGVKKEHLHTRSANCASLFDVSHMGQIKWHGADAAKFLETLLVGDVQGLDVRRGCLSLVMHEGGGIIDDTIVMNANGHVHMVVNGACKVKDMAHFEAQLAAFKASGGGGDVAMEYLGDDQPLIAVQGPGAAAAVARLTPDSAAVDKMPFMSQVETEVGGVPGCRVTRCGYTGEDGYEISMPAAHGESLSAHILEQAEVEPCGLGARDSLRLEAGLCLYGNDIDSTTTPNEAMLLWTIPKRRRAEGGFLGHAKVAAQLADKSLVTRRLRGITGHKAPAREGTEIWSADEAEGGEMIGTVTSGTFGPSFGAPVALGYVATSHNKAKFGTEIKLKVRGKFQDAKVTKMPVVPSGYFTGEA